MDRYTETLVEMLDRERARLTPAQYAAFEAPYRQRVEQLTERMHQAGVVHRDLHDGNILFRVVDGQADVRIADFEHAIFSFDPRLQEADYTGGEAWSVTYERDGRPCTRY